MLLRSLAYRLEGNESSALETLGQALTLAEPEGYVRTFVDEGEPMADLLSAAAERGSGAATGSGGSSGAAAGVGPPPAMPAGCWKRWAAAQS